MKTIAKIYGGNSPYLIEVFVESTEEGTTFIGHVYITKKEVSVSEPTEDCPRYEIRTCECLIDADEVRRM